MVQVTGNSLTLPINSNIHIIIYIFFIFILYTYHAICSILLWVHAYVYYELFKNLKKKTAQISFLINAI